MTVTPTHIRLAIAAAQSMAMKTTNKVDDKLANLAALVSTSEQLMQALCDVINARIGGLFSGPTDGEFAAFNDEIEQLTEACKAAA